MTLVDVVEITFALAFICLWIGGATSCVVFAKNLHRKGFYFVGLPYQERLKAGGQAFYDSKETFRKPRLRFFLRSVLMIGVLAFIVTIILAAIAVINDPDAFRTE